MNKNIDYKKIWNILRKWISKNSKDTSYYDEFAVLDAVLREMDKLEKGAK